MMAEKTTDGKSSVCLLHKAPELMFLFSVTELLLRGLEDGKHDCLDEIEEAVVQYS